MLDTHADFLVSSKDWCPIEDFPTETPNLEPALLPPLLNSSKGSAFVRCDWN